MTGVPPKVVCHCLETNPDAKRATQKESFRKEGKAQVAAKIMKDLVRMKEGQRLSRRFYRCHKSRVYPTSDCLTLEHDVGRMFRRRELQISGKKKAEPSTLKVRLQHITRRPRSSWKRETPTKEWAGAFATLSDKPEGADTGSKFPEENQIVEDDISIGKTEAKDQCDPVRKGSDHPTHP